ncbi:hypothetical protein GCM10023225_02360 [Kineococcus glutinatus]|uniref:Fibronectin type III-like domain-containing protein n=2 Tax=Kineococcus glutinatus TaxID=1070872 RepID=A0ABP9H4S1_9ACTN
MTWPPRFGSTRTLVCEDLVPIEESLRERAARDGADVTFDAGTDTAAAAAEAAAADVAVVVVNVAMGEFADLPDLRLTGNGDELVSAVAAANPRTVVVLQTGSAVEMPWIGDVPSVVQAWYGGEQQGPALASLLFGDTNFSGKLPMTFPESLADTPTRTPEQYPGVFADGSTTRPEGSEAIRQVNYTEGLQVGYRWYQEQGIEPLFPFGHGLSYTSFAYSHLRFSPSLGKGEKGVHLTFRLTNTGERAGTEVAQAYLELPEATGEPGRRLVGWERVTLQPGQSEDVKITLSYADVRDLHLLQHWDERTDRWTTARGTYGVHVGGSSDTALSRTVRIP